MYYRSKAVFFPSTFSKEIRTYGKRFTLQNILSIRSDSIGVYIFYYNHHFIYVGQSGDGQGIRNRLQTHFNGSHNEQLSAWIKALDGRIKFTHITCCDKEIDDLEKSLIIHLQPITNVARYSNYTPKPTNWRKTYG